MINLHPTIERIYALLAEDTEASVTYAALEARLALEKICYDRLRQCHDYISHDQLGKWQPGAVANFLMKEVDPHIPCTGILKISRKPAEPGIMPDDSDFVVIGTEIGFDPNRISKMWQALAKLALHIQLPTHRQDHIPGYGDKKMICAKVREVVTELEQLAKSTMSFSGIGHVISFNCGCGTENKRRTEFLRDQQYIYCINPKCKVTWKAIKEANGFRFEEVALNITCEKCKSSNFIPWREFFDMKYDVRGSFLCHSCRHRNYVEWQIVQVSPEPGPAENTGE